MAGLRYKFPARAIEGADIAPGGSLSVLLAGTDDPAALFGDADLTVPIANPLTADGGGYFPPVYIDLTDSPSFDVIVTDEPGNILAQYDDLLPDVMPLSLTSDDPRSLIGELMAEATLTFFRSETTQLIDLFADELLTTPLDNPVTADTAGAFPAIWLAVTTPARVILKDGDGVLQLDVDHTVFYPGNVPPSAPVLSGEVVEGIELEWTASVSSFSTVAGYRLYKSTNGGAFLLLVDQVGRTHTDSTVSEGNTYAYYVIGYDVDALDSEPSNVVSFSINATIEVIESTRDWTKPDGLLEVEVTVFGGGAGGRGGGGHNSLNSYSGHGGGGGGISVATYAAGDLPDTVTCTIGAGGAGGAGGNSAVRGLLGAAGGATSFGVFLTASGGGAGINETGGAGGTGDTEDGGGGSDGAVNIASQPNRDPGDSTTLSGAGGGAGGFGNGLGTMRNAGDGGAAGSAAGGVKGASVGQNLTGDLFAVDGSPGTDGADYGGGGGGGGGGGCTNTHNDGALGPSTAHAGAGGAGGLYGGGGGGGGQAQRVGSAIRSFGGDGGDGGQGAIILRYTYA